MTEQPETDGPIFPAKLPPATRAALAVWVALCLMGGATVGSVTGRFIQAGPHTAQTEVPAAPRDNSIAHLRMVEPCPDQQVTGTPGTPEITTYTVKQGDTLWEIARMYGTDVESLAAINDITARDYLQPGQRVTVLSTPGLLCKVRPGDTLWGISSTYGVPVNEIMEANNLESTQLAVGQVLVLPGAKPGAVATARAASLSSQPVPGFAWPLNGRITSPFGRRWGRMHEGIDIAAAHGTEVKAARAGVVTFAGWYGGGYGNTVVLDHGDGISSVYAHLSRVSVNRDSSVFQGQVLGNVGSTGFAFGPHLHFEIRVNGVPQNPALSLP